MKHKRQPTPGPVTNEVTKPSEPGKLRGDGLQQCVGADAVQSEANENIPQNAGDRNAYDLSNLLLLGDAEVIMTLTEMFEATMSESLASLKFSVEKMNWDDVVFISHKLKSSLGVIQIHSIVENMSVVEMSAKKKQNLEAILPLVNASITDYYLSFPIIKSAIATKVSYLQ